MLPCALNSNFRLLRNGWNIWFVSLRIFHSHNSTRLEIGIIRFYKILLPGRLFDHAAGAILFFCEWQSCEMDGSQNAREWQFVHGGLFSWNIHVFHHCNGPSFSGEITLGTYFQTFSASRARVDRGRTDFFLLDVDFDVTDYRRLHDSAHCTFDDYCIRCNFFPGASWMARMACCDDRIFGSNDCCLARRYGLEIGLCSPTFCNSHDCLSWSIHQATAAPLFRTRNCPDHGFVTYHCCRISINTVLADTGLEHFVSHSWGDFSGYRCPCDDCAYCQAGTTFSHLSRALFDHHLWRHQCFYHSSGSSFNRHHYWFDHRHRQRTLPFGAGKTEVMIKELFNLEVSPCCLQKTLRTFTGHRSSGVEQQFRKLQVSGSIPLGGSSQ